MILSRDGQFNQKKLVSSSYHEIALRFLTKLKLFGLVLSLLRDHIQGNTVEKDF